MTPEDVLTSNGQHIDRASHPECTSAVRSEATTLAERVSSLLLKLGIANASVTSGFRTTAANKAAKGSPNSAHLYGMAVDLADPKSDICSAIMRDITLLDHADLYMENPHHTPTWVHLQTRKTSSGNRVFTP